MVALRRTWWLWLALALGCGENAAVLGSAGDGGADAWLAPDLGAAPGDEAPPVVSLTGWTRVDDAFIEFHGTAIDDARVVALTARVGFSGPYPLAAPDPADGAFSGRVPVPEAGVFPLTITAYDAGGRVATAQVSLDDRPAEPSAPPTLNVDWPPPNFETSAPVIEVRGSAFSGAGVAAVEVNAVGRAFGVAGTADHFARWARTVPLRPGAREVLLITARDTLGQTTTVERVVVSRAAPPHGPPRVVATDPVDGAALDLASVELVITTAGSAPVTGVEFRRADEAWRRARGAGDRWVAPLRLAAGPNAIEVLVTDEGGLTGLHTLTLVNTQDGWQDGPVVTLRPPEAQGGEVVFDLDRAGLAALFDADLQARTVLFEVDVHALLTRALRAVRGACAGGACPAEWGAAERGAWAALTASALGADYGDTALGPAAVVTQALLAAPLGEVLALALDRPADRPLLGEAALADALTSHLAATHPQLQGGRLTVTLADALQGLTPWAGRLGAQGAHPGLVHGPVAGRVFRDEPRLRLVVQSNLGVFEGVDLTANRPGFFAAPPVGAPVAELDFQDPERFAVDGLDPQPSVDLTLQLTPAPERAALPVTLDPQAPAGPRWTLDAVLRRAGVLQWGALRAGCDGCAGPDEGALLWRDAAERLDLVEVSAGRTGYDCPVDGPCLRRPATPVGVPERLRGLTGADCGRVEDCAHLPEHVCQRAGRDDDRGACVPADEVQCYTDQGCAGAEACLAGRCVPPARIACRADGACAEGQLCHDGLCEAVPAGWLRLWLLDESAAPPPAYAWDLVADVLGAALDDGGRAPARFTLRNLPLGPAGAAVEAALRDALHARREALAEALLGQLTGQGQRADFYLDRGPDGAVWLVIGGCDVPDEARCDGPSDDSVYRDMRPVERALPDGRTGMPLSELSPGDVLTLRRVAGSYRVVIEAVDDEEVRLWLRGEQALPL